MLVSIGGHLLATRITSASAGIGATVCVTGVILRLDRPPAGPRRSPGWIGEGYG